MWTEYLNPSGLGEGDLSLKSSGWLRNDVNLSTKGILFIVLYPDGQLTQNKHFIISNPVSCLCLAVNKVHKVLLEADYFLIH